jgi:hypothetical protein
MVVYENIEAVLQPDDESSPLGEHSPVKMQGDLSQTVVTIKKDGFMPSTLWTYETLAQASSAELSILLTGTPPIW